MQMKKRFLSCLICAAMLIGIVPTGVLAAEWVPTSETDGVGEYYEYNVNASDITPETTERGPVYSYTVPMFNDVGDIIAINFNDVAPADKNYSDYLVRTAIHCSYTKEDLEKLKDWLDPSNPDNLISQNFANGLYKNSVTLNLELYNEEDASDITYMLKINNKSYIVNGTTLVESTTPVAYPAYSAIDISIESYNDVFGTTLPEVLADDPATTIDISQIQLDKIDLQIYYKGNLVSTHNYNDLYTKPIERNMTYSYKITYKLNNDGSVTATAPAAMLVPPEAYIQYAEDTEYKSCSNKTTNDTDWVFSFTDASTAENVRVTSISTNAHHLQTTLNVTNISDILEYYKISDINPDDVTNADKPEGDYENPGDHLIKPAPDYDIRPSDKENETTANGKEDETTSPDTEDETPADDSNKETTTPDTEDVTTDIKDVTLTEDNKVVSKDDMTSLITDNATKDIVIKTPAGITLTFAKGTMKEVDGKDAYDFGVSISDDYSMQSNMGDVTKDNFVSLIDFEYSGNLPAEATIKIPVGADRAGQTLYYLQKTDTGYTLIQTAKVDAEGYITVKQDHCSTYVITTVDVSEKATVDKNDETTTDKNNETVPETETKKDTDTKKSDKDNNAVIYIVIAVIVVAVIAGVVVFVIYKKRKNETIENITEDSIEETTENKTEE